MTIPTKDSDLPSFLHPLYLEVADELALVADLWSELKDCKKQYLPKEQAEPPLSYRNRLDRTPFDSRFKPALKGHAGLLSDFTVLEDTAASITAAIEDIDLQGTDLTTFLTDLDEMVLRDGGAGVLVEYPVALEGIESAADQMALEMRPYLVAIDRRNILNWQIDYMRGKPVIRHLAIREMRLEPEGLFGVAEKTYYRVLRPGSFEVYELRVISNKWQAVLVEAGETGLDQVPFRWYSISNSKWFAGLPPFLNLARLNIEHLQKRSSLNEVLWKCNLPTFYRKGCPPIPGTNPPQFPPLKIGPNSVIDVPKDGEAGVIEPKGTAIAATQADTEKLEGAMDRVSLAFLTGGEASKTATEIMMDSAQTQCSLKNMARRKESLVQSLFSLWVEYTGETAAGGIQVNESILQMPMSSQDAGLVLDNMGVKFSDRLGLELLKYRRWLPPEVDVDAEVERLEGMPQARSLVSEADVEVERGRQTNPDRQPAAA
ncbi:DUF4055 domain-containing protein [Leptolyngbya sp. FACHB-36]|uniref:DUF4055 domain-containing protein n=1 Tax=Leptolyngbya sp. FACHB-36 TaxID=2692808 RepID=UPI001680C940|nr:DUF4055 domain-containing protein [Leptolyngbya sp. FACHB-36]MBD2019167.1 DUF4055 domain-containing protein [Leptolyngbya sp. FACHB-36]